MSIQKPSDKEDEYFVKQELERRKKEEQEQARRRDAEERQARQRLHHMKCPKCGEDLDTIGKMGVEIDMCRECKGIWLDAGELEQLLKKEEGILKKCLSLLSGEREA